MYLSVKEADEFSTNFLSEKFRRASHVMKRAATSDSSMIRGIMNRDAQKLLDDYFAAIEYTIDHHL
jgi:hypothetical protein